MKILVVKVAAIGDFLMATPALRALKRAPEVSAVHLLAGRSIAAVAGGHPDVDRVFFLDDRRIFHGNPLSRAVEVLRISRTLRRQKYDVGINFHRDWRFSIILLLAGCRRRIGFRRGPVNPLLLTDSVSVEGIKHHLFHYCDPLKVLGVFCLDFKMAFPLDGGAEEAAARKFLDPEGLADYVVLAPGGAANVKEEMGSRRWPSENFSVLAGLLLRSGRRVVLVGSGPDAVIAARVKAEQPAAVDLTGRTTLAEAAAILKRSQGVVCNDAGLMHLAAAVGARVISIFGPTHPDEKKPLGEGSVAIWKGEELECSPCYHEGAFPKCNHLTCLRKITPQEVFQTAESMLGEDKGKAEGREREERGKKREDGEKPSHH
ncbi:MAG: lipopolysaccharide heptosyltransferase II [Candidatus Aminicenantes bacterium]|nr:lipopolysaccharide heptosyltransferase II [Candidatus Aminicenantes bacterium]